MEKCIMARAIARRAVGGLCWAGVSGVVGEVGGTGGGRETMCAEPEGERCVRWASFGVCCALVGRGKGDVDVEVVEEVVRRVEVEKRRLEDVEMDGGKRRYVGI